MSDPALTAEIRASLARGNSPEQIYLELLTRGRTVTDIQEAFRAASTGEEKPETQKKTIALVLVIGAVLVAAGIFSFIAANWQEMSRFLKIVVIVLAMLAAYAMGWPLKERFKFIRTGNALILLGSIIYGANIFLIGQIFNIRANWPDGFILWMLGALVMAFAVETYSLFLLAIIVGLVAIIAHPFGIFGMFGGYNPFLLTSSFLLLAAAAATLFAGYFLRKLMLPKP